MGLSATFTLDIVSNIILLGEGETTQKNLWRALWALLKEGLISRRKPCSILGKKFTARNTGTWSQCSVWYSLGRWVLIFWLCTCEGAIYMDNVLFYCHKVCVLNKILTLNYCNPVISPLKKNNTFTLLVSLNCKHPVRGLRQSYFQKIIFFKDFLFTQEVWKKKKEEGVAYF